MFSNVLTEENKAAIPNPLNTFHGPTKDKLDITKIHVYEVCKYQGWDQIQICNCISKYAQMDICILFIFDHVEKACICILFIFGA